MNLEKALRLEPLFSDTDSEERFRQALEREVEDQDDNRDWLNEVVVGETADQPVLVGRILASLVTDRPVLISSGEWGRRTREALRRLREVPTPGGSVLIRTGGSSGDPKFAVHTWETLQNAATALWRHLGRKPLSATLDLPLFHVSGWMPIVRALVSGGRVGMPGRESDPMPEGLRLASVVPTTLYRGLRNPTALSVFGQMDCVFAGGAAFSDELLQEARQEKIRLSLVYGMTETAGMIAMQEPDAFLRGEPPAVLPLRGNSVRIGEGGEIQIQSAQLFTGYWGQETRENGYWPTGDSGQFDEVGRLTIHGRMGRFFSSGGETVSLEKVETAARSLAGVTGAAAVAEADDEWGRRLVLFVELSESEGRDVRKELKKILDPPEVPSDIRPVSIIPKTSAGKVDLERLLG